MTAYTMPAEWAPQAAMWLAWPHNKNDWPGKFAPIPWVYAEIIRHLTVIPSERSESRDLRSLGYARDDNFKVRLIVKDAKQETEAREHLERAHANLKRVEFFRIPTNRVWLRDSGPIFVTDTSGKKAMLHWRFNAWAKYPNHKLDIHVPERINTKFKLPRITPTHKGRHVVLEGGGIDVNGKGSLLTTEEWLLSDVQVRNPGFTRADYEEIFEKYLGAPNTIWLGHGITGDDTHGHVDDLARFVSPTAVTTVVERNKKDDNYAPLQDNLKRLKRARDERGKPLDIIELPMPKPIYFEDTRVPASYANFLICNDIVLVPTFNDPADRLALNLLAECFPKREIIGIHAVDLVWGFGTLHCMSQQQPA